ncbi:MAG: hypothetical protein SFV54_13625 [Bryobacteraceae bacterium]|nr:hypothetical protein [Bryobacteraceae bacterium]
MVETPALQLNALLVGLEPSLSAELGRALADQSVRALAEGELEPEGTRVDIVFAPSDPSTFGAVKDTLRETCPAAPIVVVSRVPEVSEWLDAMEAGASDYCAAPFERTQLRWLLETNLHRFASAAA